MKSNRLIHSFGQISQGEARIFDTSLNYILFPFSMEPRRENTVYKLLLLNLYFLLILVLTSPVLTFFSFPIQAEYKLNYNTQVRTSPANMKGLSGSAWRSVIWHFPTKT